MASLAEALTTALDLQTGGRLAEARALLGRIIEAAPQHPDAHHLLGLLEAGAGAHAAAAACLRRAVALSPGAVAYTHNMAKALIARGAPATEAAPAVWRAQRLTPLNAEWPVYRAQLAEAAGDPQTALCSWRHLATLQPDYADGWRRLGEAAHALNQPALAKLALRRHAALMKTNADAWVALGAAARSDDDQPAAAAAFRRALTLDPARLDALATLGNALKDHGDLDAAITAQTRARRLSGDDPTLTWNLALTLLTAGRHEEGWPALESRWRARGFPTQARDFAAPTWRGGPAAGKTILLYEEQGRGDAIQFIRYAPLLAAQGARVIVEVGRDLTALLRDSLAGVAEVISAGASLPDAVDLVCPLMSLPLAFATTAKTIPAAVPYLRADREKAARWRARLSDAALNVGVVWGGNPAFADDRRRSPGLSALFPLFAARGVRWVGLQVGPARAQMTGWTPPDGFCDLGAEVADFADSAAIVANLDLVVTSCTATAHLAGALARPTWLLLAHSADWRWLVDRDDSPWYPTARLFRQPRPGDWGSVVAKVAIALAERVAERVAAREGNGA